VNEVLRSWLMVERCLHATEGPINLASAFGSNCHEASLEKRTTTGNFAPEAGFQ
jgi:hypothetical protein